MKNGTPKDTDRIKAILKRVRRLEITTRHQASAVFSGHYRSVFRGRGIEFSEVRDYQYGDSVRFIDWNVTARMNRPYIKQFVEERELTILLCIDVTPAMYFGSQPSGEPEAPGFERRFKIDLATEMAATLAVSAAMNNDKVGLLLFDHAVRKYLPAKKGRETTMRILREIINHVPQTGRCNMPAVFNHLLHTQKKRAIVVIISDFSGLGDMPQLNLLRRKHDVIPIVVGDKREFELPAAGWLKVFDPARNRNFSINTSSRRVREQYARVARQERDQVLSLFKKRGIDFIEIFTHDQYMTALLRFFKKREKRFAL